MIVMPVVTMGCSPHGRVGESTRIWKMFLPSWTQMRARAESTGCRAIIPYERPARHERIYVVQRS